jgi:hypothetical protein
MSTLAPPGKKTGALLHAPIPKIATANCFMGRHEATRRCVSCGCVVCNRNLGGHDGHPLTGDCGVTAAQTGGAETL